MLDRRSFLTRAGLVAGGAVAAAAAVTNDEAMANPFPERSVRPYRSHVAVATSLTWRVSPTQRIAALTFDDGPDPRWTPRVHELLREHGVRATFFLVGSRAARHPELVRQHVSLGHELGNHTWSHADLSRREWSEVRAQLHRTHDAITRAGGRAPTVFRPPWGRIDTVGIISAAELDYRVILWSDHVRASDAAFDVDTTLAEVAPGGIVLAHDGGPTPNAGLYVQLDRFVREMHRRGYEFVTASELLAAEPAPGRV